MELKPSEIYFSQNNIFRKFRNGYLIGEVLDDLYLGKISVSDIPMMTVTKKPGCDKWFTVDNRRLWVFRYLEGAGKCSTVPVYEGSYAVHSGKFTTTNEGVSIEIKFNEDPGGVFWKTISPAKPADA